MPQSTDLVTDLPADFEVFGQAVATSMADLLGGTTGQILSKTTNADMDFTWTTPNPGDITGVTAGTGISGGGTSGTVTITNSMATEIAAKGDLIVGTGSATFDNLTAGSNGEILVADSSTSTGLRYQTAYNGNQIIGGGFDNWQRGTSFTSGAVYSADRWYLNAVAGTTTVSRDTDVPTGLAGNYSIKQLTAAGSSFAQWSTPLETATVLPLQGRAVVLSYYMKKNATWSNNFSPNIYYSNSTDALASQSTAVTIVNVVEPTPTTSWARYYSTFTVPSDAKGLLIQFNPSVVQASGAQLNMAGVQLEIGSVPTSFKRAGGTIQGELAACQRYYYLHAAGSNGSICNFLYFNATTVTAMMSFPVAMRTAPTLSSTTGSQFYVVETGSNLDYINSLTLAKTTTTATQLYNATEAAGTVGLSGIGYTNNASANLAFSAEL
jgi:hypothetical protein